MRSPVPAVALLLSSPVLVATAGGDLAAQTPPQAAIAELTVEAEEAIQKGLRYLLDHQNEDGSWGVRHRVAVTSLTLAAFMVKGQFPETPPHGDALANGLEFLVQSARSGGGYMGTSMYEHALATLTLSELWGMSRRSGEIRDILGRAVEVILRAQNPAGGWRYRPEPRDADISVTVMQIVALASTKEAGIVIPDKVIEKAIGYVKSCQNPSGGFSYRGNGPDGFARSAAGVCSLLLCGERSSEAVTRGLEYLHRTDRTARDRKYFYYGQLYAAQAMYQAGPRHYDRWYPVIRDALIAQQREDGSWAREHGTPMAILILGGPYGFLPIYQR